ncbi:insecticidal delta-endotoxin Cry8Ea1 family protein [Pseudomonas sp. TH31]|uniref:insecticidal delta-endotoxin Cry8Ea1 family protein n=1 Tax=Pseudomonas sp. TH31 TaxID=2796396 RepID=UPI001911CF78|nr:insecticidal delta-endotoxin Cry8Ea1 family protein [Pseudomonas sp. TH31]MBK5414732.1 hypothetical protein [Pseudomonas sp. TH31]
MVRKLNTVDNVRASLVRRKLQQGAVAGVVVQSSTGLVDSNGDPLIQSQDSLSSISEQFYDILRHSILGGANLVPVVGGLLSYLGALFIPNIGESPEQMWRRLIEAKISDALMKKVQRDLVGLSDVASLYKNAVAFGNNETIREQSIAANTQFTAMLPGFQLSGEQSALLPLFAIAATLHLALLRDMVLKGKEIGISDAHVASLADGMIALIKRYSEYVDTYVAAAIDKTRRDNPNGTDWKRRNMPLSAMLETKAHYQITVIDLRDTWSGLDPIRFPGKSLIKLDREVYTPVLGWWDSKNRPPEVIPVWERPQSPLEVLKVWDKSQSRTRFIFGFESNYADGSRLSSGSKIDTVYHVPAGRYIDEVVTQVTRGVFHMSFRSDGHWKGVGKARPSQDSFVHRFRSAFFGHRLSSVRALGKGDRAAEGAVSGCVLGFQLIDQDATSISLAAFDAIAPNIAPQLLEWIAD